jgi:DNA-binding response OmpR family regulator
VSAAEKTILVVDDEMEFCHAIKAILEDEGYRVITAGSGTEVLATLSEKKPDLLLMDVMMPRISGYDVLSTMRKQGSQYIPVVLMSCAHPRVKQSVFQWDAFLKKPFNMDDLLERVRKQLGT